VSVAGRPVGRSGPQNTGNHRRLSSCVTRLCLVPASDTLAHFSTTGSVVLAPTADRTVGWLVVGSARVGVAGKGRKQDRLLCVCWFVGVGSSPLSCCNCFVWGRCCLGLVLLHLDVTLAFWSPSSLDVDLVPLSRHDSQNLGLAVVRQAAFRAH